MRTMLLASVSVGLVVMSASVATATPVIVPSGLSPGSLYYLAFVTDAMGDATSTNIADYDAFVTAEANSDPTLVALNTKWKVIGATTTVDAFDRDLALGPVYRLDGVEIAPSFNFFFPDLFAPLDIDQHGATVAPHAVWTGSTMFGNPSGVLALGDPNGVLAGGNIFTDSTWIDLVSFSPSTQLEFYAMSGPLYVPEPTAVPEPATLMLTALDVAGIFQRYRRRSR